MSESLIFLSESLILSFLGKKQAIRFENLWAKSQPCLEHTNIPENPLLHLKHKTSGNPHLHLKTHTYIWKPTPTLENPHLHLKTHTYCVLRNVRGLEPGWPFWEVAGQIISILHSSQRLYIISASNWSVGKVRVSGFFFTQFSAELGTRHFFGVLYSRFLRGPALLKDNQQGCPSVHWTKYRPGWPSLFLYRKIILYRHLHINLLITSLSIFIHVLPLASTHLSTYMLCFVQKLTFKRQILNLG